MTTENDLTPTPEFEDAGSYSPDLNFSLITKEDGKDSWEPYVSADFVKEGYYKGMDDEGNTIIVQTLKAKNDVLIAHGYTPPNTKRPPDLYIYIEDIAEGGEKVWTDAFVVWKGKKDGYFTGKHADGRDIVGTTREAREANLKQRQTQVAPVDLDL